MSRISCLAVITWPMAVTLISYVSLLTVRNEMSDCLTFCFRRWHSEQAVTVRPLLLSSDEFILYGNRHVWFVLKGNLGLGGEVAGITSP
jgi:hypothetical protein